ncbi:hypothetical protein UFOVP617_43 [uncultured Caudovirales phage]|uniref:Uncharacterized protein n=1 Tax=uncultured Caudovirales phage TaxID=2100421 RepID=A0A6J5N4L7_9CAUD|nr:hypothetical protein UFOVP617_43 [uncultured Caudovirales phage]
MAARTLTLNQVVSQIKAIAEAHQQINTVYYGDFDEFLGESADNVYPAMYFDSTNANISTRTLTLNFSLFFFDRMLPEKINETEAVSDQLSIAQDIIAQLLFQEFEFEMSENVALTFITEDTPDNLIAVKADISLELPFTSDRCQVPTSYQYPS